MRVNSSLRTRFFSTKIKSQRSSYLITSPQTDRLHVVVAFSPVVTSSHGAGSTNGARHDSLQRLRRKLCAVAGQPCAAAVSVYSRSLLSRIRHFTPGFLFFSSAQPAASELLHWFTTESGEETRWRRGRWDSFGLSWFKYLRINIHMWVSVGV